MKCQKCGVNDVNFRYSSNVNGIVSEAMLCMQCATESGYDIEALLDFEPMSGFRPMLGRGQISNLGNIIAMIPYVLQENTGVQRIDKHSVAQDSPQKCGYGHAETAMHRADVEIDDEMSRRRELKMQLQAAIEREEFENAATLRDMLKELEAAKPEGRVKCDSETD